MGKRHTPPLRRTKRESEGFTFFFYGKTTPLPPPSLQTRVGGGYLPHSHENDTRTPSLAPKASRRGVPSFFTCKRCAHPLRCTKRKTRSFPFPLTRKQQGHALPRSKREAEMCDSFLQPRPTNPKRETEGCNFLFHTKMMR